MAGQAFPLINNKKFADERINRITENFQKIPFFSFLLFFLLTIVCFPSTVFAFGNIHISSIQINPFIAVKEGYVSNPSLNPKGDENLSAYTFWATGINCELNKTRYRVTLDYLYQLFQYDRKTLKDIDYYDLNTKYLLKFGRSGNDYNLEGGYSTRRTTEPETTEERAEDRKESSFNNAFKINLKDRFGIDITSSFIQQKYEDSVYSREKNREIMNLAGTGSVKLFTKTSLLCTYSYEEINYKYIESERDDSRSHALLAGIGLAPTAKLTGSIKGGYQWKEYSPENPDETGSHTPGLWNILINLSQRFSDSTFLSLNADRRIEDTSDYKNQGLNYYFANRISLALNHQLTYKVRTWCNFTYKYADYRFITRRDTVLDLDVGLSYQFLKWLTGTVSMGSIRRNSHESQYEIDKNVSLDYQSNEINCGIVLFF